MQFTLAQDISTLQKHLMVLAAENKRVALVPTMGALHRGHITLIKEAKKLADEVVVSIFVNPKQFGKNEDFSNYPRMLNVDANKAHEAGAVMVYAPTQEDMYPEGFSTSISPGSIGNILCGTSRPGHFDGVVTVMAKLLLRILPHTVIFGEKDYQQLCVIGRLIMDMDMPITLVGVPTIREENGLALSSRNAYLSPEERSIAPILYKVLQNVKGVISSKKLASEAALEEAKEQLLEAGFTLDYLELRSDPALDFIAEYDGNPARLFVAAWLGKTRLIDNISMGEK